MTADSRPWSDNPLRPTRTDSTEDIGFLCREDPWQVLARVHGERFREYRRLWARASSFELELDYPLQLDFELNDNCNYRCAMCTWSVEAKRKPRLFPAEKFKAILEDGVPRGLRALDLSFTNEPLIRRDLPELIRFSRQTGIVDIAFNTNASLLSGKTADSLLRSGLTRIQFSLDAHSSKVYDQVRQGGRYERVRDNILSFLKKKQDLGVPGMLTAVSFVKMSVNEAEWPAFAAFWRERVDYIILREYLSPYDGDTETGREKAQLFAGQRHKARSFRCDKPWQRLVIRADGTALPCCVFQAVQLPMGNVFETDVQTIWKSKKMRALRRIHKAGQYHKIKTCLECARCSTG